MHHKNPSRDGVYVQPALTKAAAAGLKKDTNFDATLGSAEKVYAQPLFVDGGPGGTDLVIVVSELDNVYAFDGDTGAVSWMKNLGAPVPLAMMPCGNIDPYGITGTPVIDPATRTLYVGAMVTPDGGTTKQHLVFALSIDDGTVKAGWPVDVALKAKSGSTTFNAAPQSQRGALALLDGTLYVPYGGLYGDCGNYHGWIVAISTTDPTQVQAWATSAVGGGAWAAGGVASDGTNVYIATGNTFGTNGTWSGGEAVLRFTPGANFGTPSYWAPTYWKTLDDTDADLGGSGPVLFDVAGATPSQLAVALGVDGNVYLLDRNNLGGIGTPIVQMYSALVIANAAAAYATATGTYVAFWGKSGTQCTGGTSGDLVTAKVLPLPTLAPSWCANQGGWGSPIVTTTDGHSEAIVWSLGADGDQLLHGFDGDTGATIFDGGGVTIPGMRHFNTPIAAKGRIFVASDQAVVAFKP
jgi:hypothetical protein